jgi:mRNA interferase MazF
MAVHRTAQAKKEVGFPRRGEIYLVQYDPTVGHEIQKTRPAVIVQNDVSNEYSPITIVAAISSRFSEPPFPREVIIEPSDPVGGPAAAGQTPGAAFAGEPGSRG